MKLATITLILIISLIIYRVVNLLNTRQRIRNLLVKLINQFEENGVKYWVDFGSLLGIMREGDVILGDNDGDVCILEDDVENIEKVKKVVQHIGGQYFEWGAFRVFDGHIFIDIFLVKKDLQYLIQPVVKRQVSIGEFMVTASIPNKPSDLLEIRYGKDWMVKKYKWYFLWI